MKANPKPLILVVDDEPDVRTYLAAVLERGGFEVVLAENGNQALTAMTERLPRAISLDLVMPKMSGLKFYQYILKNKERAGIPVLCLTAHAGDEFGSKDLAQLEALRGKGGKLEVMSKPIDPLRYVNTLRAMLDRPSLDRLEEGTPAKADELRGEIVATLGRADVASLAAALSLLKK
ncbi:MAG: hypothetical protein A2284_06175 [Deltaproteobacteria bacterium RIFOXYA12_FULL_61_11]|nr:MAG: hypothetical protein A2284_06175 [Deltaproteobacteria bacterium RIFOXYA12_FULL_61_11]